jgi:signal transduction histidine kinase
MGKPTRIAVTFFLASIACLAALASGIGYMAMKQDSLARDNQILMAHGGINQMAETLKTFASDYGNWDDLYVHIPSDDDEWFESNVATAVESNKVLDFLLILDKDRKPFRGWNANGTGKSDVSFVETGFLEQFNILFKDDPKGQIDARTAVMTLAGEDYLVAAANIVTISADTPFDKQRQPKLLVGYKLSGDRIVQLGKTYLLEDLTYDSNPLAGLASLNGADGYPMGSLKWTPDTPGTNTLKRAIVPISGLALLILGLGAVFAWRGDRITSSMAKREAEAQLAAEAALQALARKGRMEQLGQLTATVAHEIRNPLGSIRTSAFLVERKVRGLGLAIEPMLARINTGVTRCDDIITQLLDFSRSTPIQSRIEDLDSWLEKLLTEEAAKLSDKVSVCAELGLNGECVAFDGSRLSRAIINLVSNAAEAQLGKDSAQKTGGDPPMIWVRTQSTMRGIEIVVEDNGPGISAETILKIMEPLFTTKSFGTGLGLPAVDNIMRQHGGGLEVSSELGKGAKFTAWLPAVDAALAKAA